jgi:hypothetical protein
MTINTQYPTKYSHTRKSALTPELVADKTLIMFMSDDNWQHGELSDNMHHLDMLRSAKQATVLYMDDIDVSVNNNPTDLSQETLDALARDFNLASPTLVEHFMRFLQKYPDDEVIFACDAGVSRSGFGHWFLDVKNGHFDGMKRMSGRRDTTFTRRTENGRIGYIANAELVRLAMPYLTDNEKQQLLERPVYHVDMTKPIQF